MIFAAVTLILSVGVLCVLYLLGFTKNGRLNTLLWFILTLSCCFAIGSAVSTFIIKRYWTPITEVVRGMKRVARGDFDVKVKFNGRHNGETYNLINNFNLMTDELSSNRIMKDDFINNFSHELKTPLISIQGFTRLLKSNPDLSREEKLEYYNIIENECLKTSSMSNNILLLSQFDNQKIISNKTTFYIDEQIRNCII